MHCVMVSHTHWDREWHQTFESFRARLVDVVDRALDLVAEDPEFRFLLDGQTIVLEDYLEVRPARRKELEHAVRSKRIAIGPWYVQPDSLLPAGEAHVRNLLEGRRSGAAIGSVSPIAYTPDSFGHPAQFPQLLRGFGLESFVYWRGNGSEIEQLGAHYRWAAPDGTSVLACHLSHSYSAAAALSPDVESAARELRRVAERVARYSGGSRALLMNGSDHLPADPHTGEVARALSRQTGWHVERALLDRYIDLIPKAGLATWSGELVGGRVANLLPGAWSTRTPIKLRNRRCESLLLGWAEPWAALALALRGPDERAALRRAWRWLLPNQAHDSICGCSQDRVHEQMEYRFDHAEELAEQSTVRLLERLAGATPERDTPWSETPELAVFNPSPATRTDLVRFPLSPWPSFRASTGGGAGFHPLLLASAGTGGFAIDGEPVRFVRSQRESDPWIENATPPQALEFVARDVPPFGWLRMRLERTPERSEDAVDSGSEIAAGSTRVLAREDGRLDVHFRERSFTGLCGLEDHGDRGDSYDHEPAPGGDPRVVRVGCERRRHESGIQELEVLRVLRVPAGLSADGLRRASQEVDLEIRTLARVAPGLERVDLTVRIDNTARDHRLRLLFPTGEPAESLLAATTFGSARRTRERPDDSRWRHPAPHTFVHQGWLEANGLLILAPGLCEGELLADGTLALTLLRSVGWLSRADLTRRPGPAGPPVRTPGAQCLGPLEARLALLADGSAADAQAIELGLRAVAAGSTPLASPAQPLLSIEPRGLVLSTFKPSRDGTGAVLRLLNPGDEPIEARVRFAVPAAEARAVRLDECEIPGERALAGEELRLLVPPHRLESTLLRFA